MPNSLINETSPYLLQHAHNPVHWYAWGDEAFELAKKQNKPILVSIGYSTCHWCHVMEQESFENEAVAEFMNAHFINIKVDREERPDVDDIYMEAVQAVTGGSGGWPLNCFLLPTGEPFFGGTYFPPQPIQQRASWMQVLENIRRAYTERYTEVEEQAQKLMGYLQNADNYFLNDLSISENKEASNWEASIPYQIYSTLADNFDKIWGGFGHAPKFPGTMALRYALNYAHFYQDQNALQHVELSLHRMIWGGIYDQLRGGFARYAVDQAWKIPHFEKMLYDNALLVGLLADAYKWTKRPIYKSTIIETLDWAKAELKTEEGGFCAALDADSEGVEGKFYIWEADELRQLLGEDYLLFAAYYNIEENGNWEGQNILYRLEDDQTFLEKHQLTEEQLTTLLNRWKTLLLPVRNQRIRPGLDDKIILSWNAMFVTAYCKAYQALGITAYKEQAIETMTFLSKAFVYEGGKMAHTYKKGVCKGTALLEDYATLIDACIELYNITQDAKWLEQGQTYTQYLLQNFWDEEGQLFYRAPASQTDLIVRKKDLYDNATPSGNSTMIHNLQRLGIAFGIEEYTQKAFKMLGRMQKSIIKFPQSFGNWACAALPLIHSYKEIAIVGLDYPKQIQELQQRFLPHTFIMGGKGEISKFPLLQHRPLQENTQFFVCQDYVCQRPVESIKLLLDQLSPKEHS